MEVAESKGLPKLKYHLLPRTKGFTTAVQCLRGTGTGKLLLVLCIHCNGLFSILCVVQCSMLLFIVSIPLCELAVISIQRISHQFVPHNSRIPVLKNNEPFVYAIVA